MSNSRRFYIHGRNLPFGKIAKGPQQNHHWDDFCLALENSEIDIVHFNYALLPEFRREQVITALKSSPSLKELLIKGSTLSHQLHEDIKILIGHASLQRLCVSDFNISGHGSNGSTVAALSEVITKSEVLNSLNLQYISFVKEDLTALFAAIANSDYLMELELNTVEFSTDQLEALQKAIHENTSLRRVVYLNEDSEKSQLAINTQLQIAMGEKNDIPYSLIQARRYDHVLCRKIDYVHTMLMQLTESYLQETTSPRKRNIFEMLKAKLHVSSDASKYECIIAFKKAMLMEDQAMSQHRTTKWQRYLCNTFSFLTIIPALVLGTRSLVKYGTMRFWLPESEKLTQHASTSVQRLEHAVLVNTY